MSKASNKPTDLDETTVEDEDLSTHQETVPVPFVSGTRRLAVRWLDQPLALVAALASDTPGKK